MLQNKNQEDEVDIIKELQKIKPIVWKTIQKYLPKREPKKHYEIVRDYPQRQGKYFRPGLVLLSNEMFGGKKEKAILTAAIMQTSEDWLLIHDDIEDHSEERRSTREEYRPTLNILHGDEIAINAGDTLHLIMWKMLGDNVRALGEKSGWQIYNLIHKTLLSTAEGQFLELDWVRNQKVDISKKEYLEIVSRKTSQYTILAPLQLGAICAGIDSKNEWEKLKKWGTPFGYAFQIWDDAMNLCVTSHTQGKEIGGDILEGKRTLILSHLLQKCSSQEKAKVCKIYTKTRIEKTQDEKNYILSLIQKHKSIEYAKNVAKKYSQEAIKLFDQNTKHLKDTPAKQTIRKCIHFVANRER